MKPRRVDLVSEHASPLASLDRQDAGDQNVHVAALAQHLGRMGCRVTVLTRRDATSLPRWVELAQNVIVDHVDAGPAMQLPKDELFQHVPAFAAGLRQRWTADPPDIVHAHFWMSGWATTAAVGDLSIAQTFHSLDVVKRRYQGGSDTSPPQREAVEASLAQRVDRVVATCRDEEGELLALGTDPDRVAMVPCGVDPARFLASRPDLARTPVSAAPDSGCGPARTSQRHRGRPHGAARPPRYRVADRRRSPRRGVRP